MTKNYSELEKRKVRETWNDPPSFFVFGFGVGECGKKRLCLVNWIYILLVRKQKLKSYNKNRTLNFMQLSNIQTVGVIIVVISMEKKRRKGWLIVIYIEKRHVEKELKPDTDRIKKKKKTTFLFARSTLNSIVHSAYRDYIFQMRTRIVYGWALIFVWLLWSVIRFVSVSKNSVCSFQIG